VSILGLCIHLRFYCFTIIWKSSAIVETKFGLCVTLWLDNAANIVGEKHIVASSCEKCFKTFSGSDNKRNRLGTRIVRVHMENILQVCSNIGANSVPLIDEFHLLQLSLSCSYYFELLLIFYLSYTCHSWCSKYIICIIVVHSMVCSATPLKSIVLENVNEMY